uniref:F-box domain-containing protein n=1 Tax=Solanum tuberosum TaxID=4113 RepID=M1AF53_SOLTU
MAVPYDIIRQIFCRLPIRRICRFRSVCVFWGNLAAHINNSAVLTLIQKKKVNDTSSVFSLINTSREVVQPVSPFSNHLFEMEMVASLKGIICLCRPLG